MLFCLYAEVSEDVRVSKQLETILDGPLAFS